MSANDGDGNYNEVDEFVDDQELNEDMDYEIDNPEIDNQVSGRVPSDRPDTEFIVLDPDHPLMKRFQTALKLMLTKQLERIELEDKETAEELRLRRDEHLELGTDLYDVQQELARLQADLEKVQDEFAEVRRRHRERSEELDATRLQFRAECGHVATESAKTEQLRREMDATALRVFYLRTAKKDVRGDIAVIRRAAEKSVEELYKAEGEKLDQDFLVDRLVERVARLNEEIGLYEAQIGAQAAERGAVGDTLCDARTEIVNVKQEQRQLLSQWNSTLIGLQRRNEAYCTMSSAVKEKQDLILSVQRELESQQKTGSKEQEASEQLSILLNKKQIDQANVKKLLALAESRKMGLKAEYSIQMRTLQETETNLGRSNNDKNLRQAEVDNLRKAIEQEFQKRINLEEKIMEELRSKLTLTKASEYVNKLKVQMRDKTRHLETEVAILENKISSDSLESAKVKSGIKQLDKQLNEQENNIRDKNETINKLNQEMYRNNINVERNQGTIDQLNKKLEAMIANAGGVELGPLEITINHLNKNIQTKEDEVNESEQQWLRYQQDLVRLYNQKNDLINNVNLLKQKLSIMSQRQIRIEGSIETEKREASDIEKHLKQLQTDMVKLNRLIFHEKDSQEALEKENQLVETDFIRGLKAEELESIQMKQKLEDVRSEKEKILNELVEAERQIMQWEKKIQLTQETRDAVDSEVGQGEMKIMRCEIHRMEVRYQQLIRQQELFIQDMEKSVSRREVIATRGEALQKVKTKATTKGGIEREIVEIKRKIKQTVKNEQECTERLRTAEQDRERLSSTVDSRRQNNDELQHRLDSLTLQLDGFSRDRLSQIISLQQKQQAAKYYQQFKDNKYNRLCKTPGNLEREMETQDSKTSSVSTIVDRLCREYPQIQNSMAPIINMIEKKMESTDQ